VRAWGKRLLFPHVSKRLPETLRHTKAAARNILDK
jgi:hypothetical protein